MVENLGLALPSDAKRAAELIYQSDAPFYDYWFALPRELTLINLAQLWHAPTGSYSYRNAQVLRNSDEEVIALVFHYPAGYGAQLQIDDGIELNTLALDLDILRSRQSQLDFLFPHVPSDAWYLRTIAVHEPHRGHGLGERMLGQVIYAAREEGFTQLHVDVDSGNPGAVKFYTRHGFEILVESKVRNLTAFSFPASLRLVKSL
ncbi:GNAT family N-acetyltransferase [Chitinibacter bivalviorum]|uniref:GNAT family N-acetyltransferase n=1 Tax=Chitinibacter bivalviorum TaxID=2739434 RepID=A0A7H9BJG8_9NEIS|nr:GNAT family N-acetyltransferase [Chitinibacter bivalviorum]QLG88151.1 GNAT family N-acetyltransferase [Chitinibacter bivalviorum]